MYSLGSCPVCGDGLRGLRACCGTLVILCDECDALWSSPLLQDRRASSSEPCCSQCHRSLWGAQAHWATQAEIERAGWWELVEGEFSTEDANSGDDVPLRQSAAPEQAMPSSLPVDSPGLPGRAITSARLVLVLGALVLGVAVAALSIL